MREIITYQVVDSDGSKILKSANCNGKCIYTPKNGKAEICPFFYTQPTINGAIELCNNHNNWQINDQVSDIRE